MLRLLIVQLIDYQNIENTMAEQGKGLIDGLWAIY